MENKYRELTEEERNGSFSISSEEANGKSVIQCVAERCFEGVLADLEKAGIVVKE